MDPSETGSRRRGGVFPVPHTTWRTRRGSQVTVGGCCLPLPLGCLVTTVGLVGLAAVRLARAAGRP
jgi:hypothetical protein